MDLRAHLNIQLFCQRKRHFDDLSPVFYRGKLIGDHRLLRPHHLESQPVGKPYISCQHLIGFLGRKVPVAQYMGVDPVSVFYRDDLILITQAEPFVHPFVGGIGIVFNMRIRQDLDPVRPHIVYIFKTIFQCL